MVQKRQFWPDHVMARLKNVNFGTFDTLNMANFGCIQRVFGLILAVFSVYLANSGHISGILQNSHITGSILSTFSQSGHFSHNAPMYPYPPCTHTGTCTHQYGSSPHPHPQPGMQQLPVHWLRGHRAPVNSDSFRRYTGQSRLTRAQRHAKHHNWQTRPIPSLNQYKTGHKLH